MKEMSILKNNERERQILNYIDNHNDVDAYGNDIDIDNCVKE